MSECEHDWCCFQFRDRDEALCALHDRIAQLEAQNARYKAALEKYADEGNWMENMSGFLIPNFYYEVAQEALKDDIK